MITTFSRLRAIAIIIIFSHQLFASSISGSLTDEEKLSLDAAKVLLEIGVSDFTTAYLYLPHTFNDSGTFKEQKMVMYPHQGRNTEAKITLGKSFGRITIDMWKKSFTIAINNNKVVDSNDYTFEHDEKGRIIKAKGGYALIKKETYINDVFHIFYDDNGDIRRVEKFITVSKGKNSASAKEQFSYRHSNKTILRGSNNQIKTEVTLNIGGIKKEEKDKEFIATNTALFDKIENKHLATFQDQVPGKPLFQYSIEVVTYKDDFGQTIKDIRKDSRFEVYHIDEYEYNDMKLLAKSKNTTLTKKNDSLQDSAVVFYSNKFDAIGNQEVELQQFYNSQGILYRENVKGKFRERMEDGSWSEWQFIKL